ncbi:spermidine synthase [Streptomyces montanisoli]|uniref:Fused MFS/spermidine synthase n=1 Tax=Streptomyces montanisoli TaxID=2798581 RepID=A0A940MLT3_9ACTN|nr:fused MFS/spermidine synthase [Streptomyces montanisoli]MBP0460773.1 fused MFS/spermidine synthase [Streptomyces montanisoli]
MSQPTEAVPVTRAVDSGTARLLPDVDEKRAWLLTLDGAPQSYVDLDDPAHLEFEYVRRIAHVLDTTGEEGAPLAVVHLGGGALTLPRYLAATRTGAVQDVVEADPGIIALVAEHLPLPDGAGIAVHHADARQWLATAPAGSADAIVGDVFGGARIPAHVTSAEYAREVARVLRPEGVYAANLADGAPFSFLRPQLATFAAVFPELALIAEPAVLRGRRFGNAVLVASYAPLDVAALARRTAGDAFPARVEHGPALLRFTGRAEAVRDDAAQPSPRPPEGTFGIG